MSAGSTVRPAVTWQPLVVVLTVVALLTGGWPLASALLPDTEPVPAGSLLGSGGPREHHQGGQSAHPPVPLPRSGGLEHSSRHQDEHEHSGGK